MQLARSTAVLFLLSFAVLGSLGVRSTQAQQVAQFLDSNGPANSDWSNINNWVPQVVPNGNDSIVQILNGDPVVDANYTVNQLVTNFSTPTSSVGGPGTLTIDVNKSFTAPAILNRAGEPAGGSVLAFDGNVAINNSGGARTVARNENFAGNSIRFGVDSTLTLQTGLEVQGGVGGTFEFNGQLAGPENLFFGLNSNNVFGAAADNANYEGNLVFFRDATTVSNVLGGTLIRSGNKIQVNGPGSRIEINGPETFLGDVVVGGSNAFTFDADADQSSMGLLEIANGALTLDVDAAVMELAFANSSEIEWGTGSVNVVGFKEDTIRFGTDATGLTSAQLAAIDGGIYSLSSQGYLTTMSTSSLFGDYNEDGLVDAADYTVWRDLVNGNDALPNDNGLGTPIGTSHYDLWSENYGDASVPAAAVPEPGAVLLTLCAFGAVCRSRVRSPRTTALDTHQPGVGSAF